MSYEILVIDDEAGDVELVRRAIETGPYPCRVTIASDGIDGLSKLRRGETGTPPPDLILVDLHMPRMTGCEFLKTVKSDPGLAHIPVVVMTTSTAESDVDAAYDLGAAGYITKPASVTQLDRAIHGIETYWFSVVRIPGRTA